MRLTFTGTRLGLTVAQFGQLYQLLPLFTTMHNGMCLGADGQAATMFRRVHAFPLDDDALLIGWPSDIAAQRLRDKDARAFDRVLKPLPPLERNRKMVEQEIEWVIACPAEMVEIRRSGTWATVRYALACKKRTKIILPNGRVILPNVETYDRTDVLAGQRLSEPTHFSLSKVRT